MSLKSGIKRGLVFAKYDTLAATTRQRFMQAMPYLAADGIEIEIHPLLDNVYLQQLFTQGKRNPLSMLKAYATRAIELLQCSNYDFLWVQYELFPYLPAGFETMIRLARKPIIYDCDDAIFHQYDQHPNKIIRQILGHKLLPLLKRSGLAFCGNAYLQNYVKRYCPRAEIIPTTVDINLYSIAQKPPTGKPIIGWIGSPSTWKYGAQVADVFTSFVHENRANMLVVGAGHAASQQYPFEFRDWAEALEVADIQQMDIGVMPLPDEPWARGKCGYKLIQYMACGLPVIASPVGVNCQIVDHGVNGFLASTDVEWRAAIEQLLGDANLRKRMGQAGRAAVEKNYSIQQYGPRMAQLIQELLASQL